MATGRAALIWRAIFAFVAWAALALQYGLMVSGRSGWTVVVQTINFLSFFTILTNVLVALAMTLPVVGASGRLGRWAGSEGVRAGATLYAVVVGLVYHFLLRPAGGTHGLLFVANGLLHYVMPAAMLSDWLMFTAKGRLRWVDAVKWLTFPLIYGVWTLAHGTLTGWYPYWFIDVTRIGLAGALRMFAALLVFFLLAGLAVVAIDRTAGRPGQRDRAAPTA